MRKLLFGIIVSFLSIVITLPCYAVDLWQAYQQAQKNDATLKIALARKMSAIEAEPQALASLLPQLQFTTAGSLSRNQTKQTNPAYTSATARTRSLNMELNLQQTVFNFTAWQNYSASKDAIKAAEATYNAAVQDLMLRTAKAYFAVLQAEEDLRYTTAEKEALYQEYVQAEQSFKVGIKTITDVYNAKASYDGSVAEYVAAKNDVSNKKEDLRVITGVLYQRLTPLKKTIPLVSPNPSNINLWVSKALQQNWQLIATQYQTVQAQKNIKAAFGGHLPTLDATVKYDNDYTRTFGTGRSRTKGPTAELDLSVPIFSGGSVSSQVRQRIADYEAASNTQDRTGRDVLNQTRQSYLGVLSDISSVRAQKQAVISNRSSLEGTREGYKVGTRTMVDVLIAQKSLYQAQKNYAAARYSYIINSVNLKQAAGTLSDKDLSVLNSWLLRSHRAIHKVQQKKTKAQPTSKVKSQIGHYSLQVGVYTLRQHANHMVDLIKSQLKRQAKIVKKQYKNRTTYYVEIGPISTREKALQISRDLQSKKIAHPILIRKK